MERSARLSMYAFLACPASCWRSAFGSSPFGSTCRSKRSRNAWVPGVVLAVRSGVLAQEAWAAIRARRDRWAALNRVTGFPVLPLPDLVVVCSRGAVGVSRFGVLSGASAGSVLVVSMSDCSVLVWVLRCWLSDTFPDPHSGLDLLGAFRRGAGSVAAGHFLGGPPHYVNSSG
jgi:hypothetical protein